MQKDSNNTKEMVAYCRQRKSTLHMLQSLPLQDKVVITQQLIDEAISIYGEDHIYLSFSGGKDSTVLSHIARIRHPSILHVFSNTSCEYPETISFVAEKKKAGVNIVTITPFDRSGKPWTFERAVLEYGYPLFSKAVANGIRTYRNARSEETRQHSLDYMNRRFPQYLPYLDENISDLCCEKLKKGPLKRYAKQRGLYCSIIGTLAVESQTRMNDWLQYGSNIFGIKKDNQCRPLSFWTDADIYQYINMYQLQIAKLYALGYQRNGCMFCGFGISSERKKCGINRFERLRQTHPEEYEWMLAHFKCQFDKCGIIY